MFTGLVEFAAPVAAIVPEPPGVRLVIDLGKMAADVKLGDSIALNGCCLTVIDVAGPRVAFQAGPETLKRTNLGELTAGGVVNIERSLKVGDQLGGHYVTGHIDAVGTLLRRDDEGDWSTLWFQVPVALTRQMASKGSVAVDGVSLTLVDVEADRFSVALIPHTLTVTTLGRLRMGGIVNLETDILAKYVEKQLTGTRE